MLDRRDFLRLCGLLGIGTAVAACSSGDDDPAGDDGDHESRNAPTVIIVGAGAAGMAAGHLLAQRGVRFTMLEAASVHGGRIKRSTTFVDFPIPLGAEWLHAGPETLDVIVADGEVVVTTMLAAYRPDDLVGYVDDDLELEPMGSSTDLKFVGSSWLDFFDEYIVPSIAGQMVFDTPVETIDSSGDEVVVTVAGGEDYRADAVIVTVPVSVLRDGVIDFIPDLPAGKSTALREVDVWGGIKVFLEFDERFFPVFTEFRDSETDRGQRAYYDAAYAQDSEANVLGLFAVGDQAKPYQARTGDDLRDYVLEELDEVFDGAASRTYRQHIVQNWDEEPFIHQAYVADGANHELVAALGEPVGDRLYFAGEAYTDGEDWGSVHAAVASALVAVETLLAGR